MLHIPTISFDEIASYYSLIRVSHLGVASPISCTENTVTRAWEAPIHPVENGKFIGDTIYEEPKSISMSVFIKSDMLPVFEAQIKLANNIGVGFNIFTLGGIYNNMFVVNFSRPESPNVSTGYLCDVTFQEIPMADNIGDIIALGSTAVAAAVNTINTGTVQPVLTGILESGDIILQTGFDL